MKTKLLFNNEKVPLKAEIKEHFKILENNLCLLFWLRFRSSAFVRIHKK